MPDNPLVVKINQLDTPKKKDCDVVSFWIEKPEVDYIKDYAKEVGVTQSSLFRVIFQAGMDSKEIKRYIRRGDIV